MTGSSDLSQKERLDDLKKHCDYVFVVLNKIDQWDDLHPSSLIEIIEQWKNDLGVKTIYPTCVKGYDPRSTRPTMDIRGVNKLRNDIDNFLEKKGKIGSPVLQLPYILLRSRLPYRTRLRS